MIISFRDKKTEMIFNGEPVRGVDKNLVNKIRRRLELLNAAQKISDLFILSTFQSISCT